MKRLGLVLGYVIWEGLSVFLEFCGDSCFGRGSIFDSGWLERRVCGSVGI